MASFFKLDRHKWTREGMGVFGGGGCSVLERRQWWWVFSAGGCSAVKEGCWWWVFNGGDGVGLG
ncbi:hypothetical protein HanIR_Chr11g0555151 [Helianthus annuus]|nr:hypothetical protein HanIR_Chr11g0555151 [Helianthus annuus]